MKNSFIPCLPAGRRFLFVASVLVLFLTASVYAVDLGPAPGGNFPQPQPASVNPIPVNPQLSFLLIPQKIAVSGIIGKEENGVFKPIAEKEVDLSLSVYDKQEYGQGNLIWSEIKKDVSVSNGVFFTYLDEFYFKSSPIPFDRPYFVEISVSFKNSQNPFSATLMLSPRQPLTSVPYALNASKIEGKSLSEVKTEIQAGGIAGGDAVVKNPTAEQKISNYGLQIEGDYSTIGLKIGTGNPDSPSVGLEIQANQAITAKGLNNSAGIFETGTDYSTLLIKNSGKGSGISTITKTGTAGEFKITDPAATSTALIVENKGSGPGLKITNTNDQSTSTGLSIFAGSKAKALTYNSTNNIGLFGSTSNNNVAFFNSGNDNPHDAVYIENKGQASGLKVRAIRDNSSGIIVTQDDNVTKPLIKTTGKGKGDHVYIENAGTGAGISIIQKHTDYEKAATKPSIYIEDWNKNNPDGALNIRSSGKAAKLVGDVEVRGTLEVNGDIKSTKYIEVKRVYSAWLVQPIANFRGVVNGYVQGSGSRNPGFLKLSGIDDPAYGVIPLNLPPGSIIKSAKLDYFSPGGSTNRMTFSFQKPNSTNPLYKESLASISRSDINTGSSSNSFDWQLNPKINVGNSNVYFEIILNGEPHQTAFSAVEITYQVPAVYNY